MPCKDLLDQIEHQNLVGFTSAHVLSEVTHKMMTFEAAQIFGWFFTGIANRMKRHPGEVQKLVRHRQALDEILALGLQIVPTTTHLVSRAADISQKTGLLTGDALILATMQDHGLTFLASHDADFDRVPGITRYSPV